MPFVDFAEVKARVSILDAMTMLGITLKQGANGQFRGICPICKSPRDRGFVISPDKGLFFCFGECGGGDQIKLVQLMKSVSAHDAALFLQGDTKSADTSVTVPQEQKAGANQPHSLQPLDYLDSEHDAVTAVGFDTRVAKELGIGWAAKGVARGNVLIPVRDEHGILRGYVGIQEATFLPKDFQPPPNVVQFQKKKA
jgi:DNA primase